MLNEKKVVPKLRQEVKVKFVIVTSDDIKIYYTGKFQDFTARYIIKLQFVSGYREKLCFIETLKQSRALQIQVVFCNMREKERGCFGKNIAFSTSSSSFGWVLYVFQILDKSERNSFIFDL